MLWVLFIFVLTWLVYIKYVKPTLYWKERKVFYVMPWVRFFKVFIDKKSFAEVVKDAYNEFPDRRYFGSFQFFYPSLFVRDLELIKQVTVKDFDHFTDHFLVFNNETDTLASSNLFALQGDKWRDMRSTLSPAFTSSKMKSMFMLMTEIAEDYTSKLLEKNGEILEMEMKDLYSKYTNDIIATCAFGIECNSLADDTNDFFVMGKTITTVNRFAIRALLIGFFPNLLKLLNVSFFPKYVRNFFITTVKDTIAHREKEGVIRPDMIHLLLEARKGRLKHENQYQQKEDPGFATVQESSVGKNQTNKIDISDELITAQAMVFFFAGFDTSSTVMSFLSYEIALNQDIQAKLHEEIDEMNKENNRKISYEEILKLKYLDQVISETLRKYPPAFALNRICTKDYKIEAKEPNETSFVLSKGCALVVPVMGIHWDPQYFPNPEKFDPDRFSDENRVNIVPGSYIPFGNGPRNCIGSRFALLETKAFIVYLLSKFEIHPIQKTAIPLKLSKTGILGSVDGFWLGLKKKREN